MATIPEEFQKLYDYLIETNKTISRVIDLTGDINKRLNEVEILIRDKKND